MADANVIFILTLSPSIGINHKKNRVETVALRFLLAGANSEYNQLFL